MNDPNLPASKSAPNEFLIVGLGASAGGIQALKEFFENVPADSGIAYVVILHLSPEHDSKLAQVLQAVAKIQVAQVTEKVLVAPNCVYVVPPNQHLEMQDGSIIVTPNTLMEERRAPVDIFFRTLAESHGSRAVAVVLSGTGANGSMGLKRVKEKGGAAFVQNPREAEFNEMPRNAIATDLVDDILPVAEIPARIIAYKKSLGTVEIPIEPEARPEDQQQALREVFTQLRVRTGHDFSNYKRPTLLRRIERRINIRNLPNLPAYATFMRENPDETQALLKDLLISVTNFFRDHRAFEAVERTLLPRIFEGKKGNDQVRIWAVGCATGEEAYSIAMLCAERTMGAIDAPKVQIFATDIDEAAIATAREGLYSINDAADVSPERLRRFFTKEGDDFRIRREIREMVLFANHNVIKDPPFSRLDLVTCRNMLIYLNNTAQERVMETLHFALNPGGYLFLGGSESVDGAGDLFASVSREHHIFQSRQVSSRPYPVPESVPMFRFEPPRSTETMQEKENRALERITYGDLHQQLLEQYAPPSVVVNEEYEIVHLSERAGRYLQIAGGEPSTNLLKLIRQELRLELRSALYQAVQRNTNVQARNLKVRVEEHTETLNIHVRPVLRDGDTARGFLLVLFEQVDEQQGEEIVLASDEPVAHQLEEELIRVKAQLRSSIEQHELQAEELKASNEELQAMNEELRSAAEELETSKEELQSINEELTTVNQELKVKVEEVTITSNNLQNLINSTDIATIFLDRSLRVNLFSPATRSLFNLIQADFGRPLSDITHRLDYNNLLHDAEVVLEKLQTVEKEINATDGRSFLMRVLPYRTSDDRIQGVVITFLDITARKQADDALRDSEEKFRMLFESMDEGYCIIQMLYDADGQAVDWRFLQVNPAFEKHNGLTNALGKTIRELAPDIEPKWMEIYGRVAETGESLRFEEHSETLHRTFDLYAFRVGVPEERKVAVLFTNITERKRAAAALHESEEKFHAFVSAIAEVIYEMSADWREMRFLEGKEFIATTEQPRLDWTENYIPEAERERVWAAIKKAIATKSKFELEHQVFRIDGTLGWTFSRAIPLLDEGSEIIKWFGAGSDITERKCRDWQQAFLLKLGDALRSQSDAAQIQASVTELALDYFGADRCYYSEVEDNKAIIQHDASRGGLPTVAGVYPLDDFPLFKAMMNKGVPLVVQDANTTDLMDEELKKLCVQMQVISFINVPVIKNNEYAGNLCITQSTPRNWADFEIELAEEIAERTWAAVVRARAEAALRDSEERLRLLMESVTDYAIFTTDNEGLINSWNAGAEHMFGYTEAEATGQPAAIIFTPEDRAAGVPEEEMRTAQAAGRAADERWHVRKDGTRFYVSGVTSALHSGKHRGFVKIARDLTERQQTEEGLRRLGEQLEQAVQERTKELSAAYESLVREVGERRAAEERVTELLRQVISAQESERRRISRELHDSLGQQLTALRMGLEAVSKAQKKESNEQLTNLMEMLKRLDSEVDFLAWELRPAALDELGLAPALATYVQEWSQQFGVAADFHTDEASEERLPYEVETNLYRIAQEALNNIAKHAQATQVSVLLERRNDYRALIIEDNGTGFDFEQQVESNEEKKRGLGLVGMVERATLIGGTLEVESSSGNGTTIFARVPLIPKSK